MSRILGYVILAVCLFVAYQGYENSRKEAAEDMAVMAKRAACDVDASCVLKEERAAVVKTDIFRRRYQYVTTVGAVLVTCDRAYIWLGEWGCRAEKGTF